jgi:hypothetical protein
VRLVELLAMARGGGQRLSVVRRHVKGNDGARPTQGRRREEAGRAGPAGIQGGKENQFKN